MRERILLVEDEQSILEIMQKVLESHGYRVNFLTRGAKALEFIAVELPDLVVLDMLLPDKNGDQICHEIKSNPTLKNIPVLMTTGFPQEDIEANATVEYLRPNAYLRKPFTIEDLMAKIRELLSYQKFE